MIFTSEFWYQHICFILQLFVNTKTEEIQTEADVEIVGQYFDMKLKQT